MSIRDAILNALGKTLVVIPRPDEGDGGAWWVGLDLNDGEGNTGGLWDTSAPDYDTALKAAQECRLMLADAIMAEITKAERE